WRTVMRETATAMTVAIAESASQYQLSVKIWRRGSAFGVTLGEGVGVGVRVELGEGIGLVVRGHLWDRGGCAA
ncbi:hypothetical protein, partial [Kocuria sp. NPDC057446]|uniref:hypothetical protein n=1 Tax=Kocuria sp. NPDC057446 TaxID=3346137 RepID=UPI00367EC340